MRRMTLCLAMIVTATVFGTMTSRAQELTPAVHAFDDSLALTPPMGWYPWNTFGEEPQNERLIKEITDALIASGAVSQLVSHLGGGKLAFVPPQYRTWVRYLFSHITPAHCWGIPKVARPAEA